MDNTTIFPLTAARVLTVQGDPDTVILALRSGDETMHFAVAVEDLAVLAERLRLDAVLLGGRAHQA